LNVLNTIRNWNLFLNIFLGWPLFWLGLYQIKLLKEKLLKVEVFCVVFMLAALILGAALLWIIKTTSRHRDRGRCCWYSAPYF